MLNTTEIELRALSQEECRWDLLLEADPSRDRIAEYLPVSSALGLFLHRELVGIVVVGSVEPRVYEIHNITVMQAYRNKGLGQRLLEAAIAFARSSGAYRINIGTGNSSLGQLYLYQKVGFRIAGVITDYFVKHYPEPIVENNLMCRDMIRLTLEL